MKIQTLFCILCLKPRKNTYCKDYLHSQVSSSYSIWIIGVKKISRSDFCIFITYLLHFGHDKTWLESSNNASMNVTMPIPK